MPLYEYKCRQCGRTVERIQKFSDPLLETCEACGGAVERLIGAPAFHFKGTGWYVTDYPRKGANGDAKKSDTPAGESKPAETKASDSKTPSEPRP